jgi:hypothetical protein
MPQIIRVSCLNCGFAREEHIPLTLVVADDGTEHICRHPGEKREAERITRREWRDLRREGRILHRYALFCLACGAVDHYKAARPRSPSRLGLIRAITFAPKPSDASGIPCSTCGADSLRPLTGSFAGVSCLICDAGELTSAVTGIS